MNKTPKKQDNLAGLRQAGPYIALGWQIALSLAVWVAIGYALDQWLDTTPWFILAGSMFGIISIFVHVFRLAQRLDQEEARRKKRGRESGRETPDG